MEDFFKEDKEPAQQVTKKRKLEKSPVDDDLRKRAQLFCVCPEQWRSVSRYSKEKLAQFVEENQFREQQQLQNTVFSFVQRALATGLDMISRGNGFVREQVENDQSLHTAIAAEGVNFIALLNNKVKLLALLSADVMTGKLNQQLKSPQITEIKNDDNPIIFSGKITGQRETGTMPSVGETTGDPVRQQAECYFNLRKKGDGEDGTDSECTLGSDSTEICL